MFSGRQCPAPQLTRHRQDALPDIVRLSRLAHHPGSEPWCRAGFIVALCVTAIVSMNRAERMSWSQYKPEDGSHALMSIYHHGVFQGWLQLGLQGQEVLSCDHCGRRYCRPCCRYRYAYTPLVIVAVLIDLRSQARRTWCGDPWASPPDKRGWRRDSNGPQCCSHPWSIRTAWEDHEKCQCHGKELFEEVEEQWGNRNRTADAEGTNDALLH